MYKYLRDSILEKKQLNLTILFLQYLCKTRITIVILTVDVLLISQ